PTQVVALSGLPMTGPGSQEECERPAAELHEIRTPVAIEICRANEAGCGTPRATDREATAAQPRAGTIPFVYLGGAVGPHTDNVNESVAREVARRDMAGECVEPNSDLRVAAVERPACVALALVQI